MCSREKITIDTIYVFLPPKPLYSRTFSEICFQNQFIDDLIFARISAESLKIYDFGFLPICLDKFSLILCF